MRHLWVIGSLCLALGAVATAPETARATPGVRDGSRIISDTRSGGVRLLVRAARDGQIMDVYNGLDVPVNVVLGLSRTVNLAGRRGPIQRSVPPRTQVRLAHLQKRDRQFPLLYQHSFSYSVDYSPEPGKAGAVAGPAYELPWIGGPFRLSQGAGGDFSHNTPKGRYAVDVAMPEGTPIVAARDGTVLEVRNSQKGRHPDPAGNYVRIRHADGTHSAYLHLQHGSVVVKPGDAVTVGTLLGKSGNTGRSTGPHLHFVVQQTVGGSTVSIPFRFTRAIDSVTEYARN